MTFDSYIFLLIFLPLFVAGFYLVRSRFREPEIPLKIYLIISSLIFFTGFGLRNFLIFAISVIWNTCFAMLILSGRRKLFAPGVIGDVIFLAFFKYSGVMMPIAVSFYTFQGIYLLADIYRGRYDIQQTETAYGSKESYDHTPGLLDFVTFLTFFPKLLQGPIVRFRDFMVTAPGYKNMTTDNSSVPENLARGFTLLTLGLAKKVLLADVFGKAVALGYDRLAEMSGPDCIIIAVSYSFQLYLDFSGYSDMAMGIAQMIGFKLPLNFNQPYKARDIVDFWKRWHISLTGFFTHCVYIPLGGNRKGRLRLVVNILIVFLLSAVWHGTGWGFVIWGLMHGVLFAITRLLHGSAAVVKDPLPVHGDDLSAAGVRNSFLSVVGGYIRMILTFIYVTLAWVFFRAPDPATALELISRIFTRFDLHIHKDLAICFRLDELWYPLKFTPVAHWDNGAVVCLTAFILFSAFLIFAGKSAVDISKRIKPSLIQALVTGAIFGYSVLTLSGVSDFLYLNF